MNRSPELLTNPLVQPTTAILLWAVLPVAASAIAASNRVLGMATVCLLIAVGSMIAAVLARSTRRLWNLAASFLLLLAGLPFAALLARQFVLGFGDRMLEIAESPVGFVVTVFVDSVFAVPPLVLAVSVARRAKSGFE